MLLKRYYQSLQEQWYAWAKHSLAYGRPEKRHRYEKSNALAAAEGTVRPPFTQLFYPAYRLLPPERSYSPF
jgi:hypothetical protein